METDDLLPLSALEHLAYCERRCALVHVEGLWAENEHTALGHLLHRRVDAPDCEERTGVRVVRRLALRSERLGLVGFADVVEFHQKRGVEVPYPVEYKKGHRRRQYGTWQLAAQAMALEEMTGIPVPEGAVYHAATRRRRTVVIDTALRRATQAAAARLHQLVAAGQTPPAHLDARCGACSLRRACVPEAPAGGRSLQRTLRTAEGP